VLKKPIGDSIGVTWVPDLPRPMGPGGGEKTRLFSGRLNKGKEGAGR